MGIRGAINGIICNNEKSLNPLKVARVEGIAMGRGEGGREGMKGERERGRGRGEGR